MAKYDGFMLLTDLDGTFTSTPPSTPNADGNDGVYVSRENCEAVSEFIANGGIFTYATGRRPDYIKEKLFCFVKPNAPMIISNGAAIFDFEKNEPIERISLPEKAVAVPLEAYHEWKNQLECVWLVAEDEEFCIDYSDCDCEEKLKNILSLDKIWYKYVFVGNDEESTLAFQKYLTERYADVCSLPRSWPTGQEILNVNATKGECAKLLKKLYPDVHTLICVGDYENDISMIELADKGYAVGNALESVKNAADFVTVSNNDSAIAKIIAEI